VKQKEKKHSRGGGGVVTQLGVMGRLYPPSGWYKNITGRGGAGGETSACFTDVLDTLVDRQRLIGACVSLLHDEMYWEENTLACIEQRVR